MSAKRIESHIFTDLLKLLVILHFLIIGLGPCRQICHIVSARDKLSILGVKPECSIGTTSCWQDSSPILIRHTDYLRLKIGMHPDLVADGRCQ